MVEDDLTDRCSWLEPDISWNVGHSLIGLILPAAKEWHFDVIELIANGSMSLPWGDDKFLKFNEAMSPDNSIRESAQNMLVNTRSLFSEHVKPSLKGENKTPTVTIYFHGIYQIASANELFILLSPLPANGDFQIEERIVEKAVDVVGVYKGELKTSREAENKSQAEWQSMAEEQEDEERQRWLKNASAIFGQKSRPKAPVFDHVFCSLLDKAEWLRLDTNLEVVTQLVGCIYKLKGVLPSRVGEYVATELLDSNGTKGILINWTPETSTGFPEIKSTVESLLPGGFDDPRRTDISSPSFVLETEEKDEIVMVEIDDLDNSVDDLELARLSDLVPSDVNERADRAKNDVKEYGIEAFGWYQPFHVWSDETWGIYLQTDKIEDLASKLFSDGVKHFGHALTLAIGIVYEHEYFHARSEASTTWLELVSHSEKYRSYKRGVYDALAMTENWLEEALANWTAMMWVKNHRDENTFRIVQKFLEFSPPGYRDWTKGYSRQTWRRYCSELVSGVASDQSSRPPLPMEQILVEGHGFELLRRDVPTRFVGKANFVDHFFSVPSRREAIKVLTYHGYSFVPRKGKGSHDTWCNEARKCFGVPQKDPLSRDVFSKMLHHLEITKKDYISKIRPLL